ncbi:carbohydrate sulfotransferase 5-like [Pecten maximus]|uniref:carbohydrate sulfotransferase 5-like n=1 Tax=Pecten maximus TaxID=6579 RepID=UPI0014583FF6|nr:carbohydrate sulfotransferase 5-like [Pecten maximus]
MRFYSKLCPRKKLIIILTFSVIGLCMVSLRRSTSNSVNTMTESEGHEVERFHDDQHTDYKTKNKSTQATKILILTYMRSGSSFVAESLQQGYNHTFYSFEPFWEIYKKGYITSDKVCHRNNRCSMITDALKLPEMAISILKDMFECKLDSLPEEVLHTFSKFEQLADHTRLEKCFPILKKRQSGKIKQKTINRMAKTRSKCIGYLERKCRASKQLIVKSIRVSLQLTKAILENIKDLKVIHLIRDPRAILQSRKGIGEINNEGFVPFTKQLCNRMSRDIDEARALMDSHPERVFPLRYECLAERPVESLRKIYSDMSLPFTSQTEVWINTYTKGMTPLTRQNEYDSNYTTDSKVLPYTTSETELLGNHSTDTEHVDPTNRDSIRTGYTVFKANSSRISSGWRLRMPYREVTLVDSLCGKVYEKIGVYPFKSQLELEDLSHSDRYDTNYIARYCR